MAKPKPSSSSPSLATSKTFSKPKENRKPFTHGSRRRPLISSPVPSSGLLAFLAGLTASSSTAYGHPIDTQVLPPEFLCPGLASDHPSETLLAPQPRLSRRVERRDDSDRPRPSQRHLAKRDSKRPFVPPKYVQGQDGRWRKIANWTLYGYCNCEPSSTEYSTLPVADNDVEATSASIFPSDSLPTIMEDQLPPGWKSSSESNHVLTYIILVLSLILAVLICIFMIGCIAWRKKRKERRDLEKTASSSSLRLGYESEEENEELRQAKKQQKLWAKASARWKANVRHSARRRRTQRNISSSNSLARASRTSLASTTMAASSSSVEAHMRSVVDVSDISLPSNSLDHENPPENETELPSSSASIIEPRPPAVPVSSRPPSYLRNSQPCPSSHHSDISERLTLPESVGEPINELSTSHKTRDVDLTELDHTSQDDLPPSPYEETPLDAAHVATDDKNILARMAAMASAPPVADQSNPSQSGQYIGTIGAYPRIRA
ncbi:hypothetical protein QCA50_010344 [Cerrena zonata]|uniref:Uncharacterized protein n=1 Tax=Cerrena zonata TaxID=2478898 RepID=A0AAW0G4Y8_9APHY